MDVAPGTASGTARIYTGSGPASWRHDGTPWGISDLNGNLWEWVGGARQLNGEIHVIADNDAAVTTADQSAGSAAWKAILEDGSLVAPGTALTLKWDGDRKINTVVATPNTAISTTFTSLVAASGVTIPDRLKHLLLAPYGTGLSGDYFYCNNQIEGIPIRGGHWNYTANAGVFGAGWSNARANTGATVGFRPAFVA